MPDTRRESSHRGSRGPALWKAVPLLLFVVFLPSFLHAGRRLPGDVNRDGRLDISDPVSILGFLFLGTPDRLPCGDGTSGDPANLALLDVNGDLQLNLADPLYILGYLFIGGAPPALGSDCVEIDGCADDAPGCVPPPSWEEVQPLLVTRCKPCHTGSVPESCSGGTCFASFYEDNLLDSLSCGDQPVYACSLERVLDGSMPLGRGCTGDPEVDAGRNGCLGREELDLLSAWVAAGAPR